ncbi:MAG: multicopper oxidase domain-containing protein, partial [Candidatus Deferrimicrobiaceae bacterium]
VMQFRVNSALLKPQDAKTTDPTQLVLNGELPLGGLTNLTPRLVSLNEEESSDQVVCFDEGTEEIIDVGVPVIIEICESAGGEVVPFGPTEALLGTVTGSGSGATGNSLKWTDSSDPNNIAKLVTLQSGATLTVNVTENPAPNSIEEWDIYNFTADAHPIHLHLVRFEVIGRIGIDGTPSPNGNPQPWETGFKDTVISYPDEITTVKALFDIEGLYVWHCHIVEHEDNEMMRPYAVGLPTI